MSQIQTTPANALETEPVGKLLRAYSIPAIIGMTITSLYNIVDSIFIGRGVGALGLSALTVAFPLMNLIMAISMLFGAGGAAVTSLEIGRKNLDKAFKVLGQATVFSLALGLLCGSMGLLLLDPVLRLFGASQDTLPYARQFMGIVMFATPVFFFMMSLNNIMRASGYPRKAMLTSIFSVALNVILAPIFIFSFKWGMRGAALATVISQALAMTWLLAHFMNKSNLLHFKAGIFKPELDVLKPILSIGLAPFLMNVCSSLVVTTINLSLARYGGDMAIGAYGIGNRLLMLFGMIIMGLSQGMQPIIGFNFGARRYLRVRKTLKYAMLASSVVAVAGFVIAQFFPVSLAKMFTTETELIALSASAVRYMAAAFFLLGAQIIASGFFQYVGMAKIAIFLSLSRQMLFLLPALFILPRFFNLTGIWLSLPVADVTASLITLGILWWSLRKMQKPYDEQAKEAVQDGSGGQS